VGAVLKEPKLVLIDVDGTLVDSVPDLAYCIDALMDRLGLPVRGEAAVRNWVGNGVERLVKRALVNDLDAEPDTALYEQALPVFLELYADNTSKRSQLYPGVREGLDFLSQGPYRVGSVTNKAARFTEPLLEHLGIVDRFEIVISGDTLPRKKPDPLPLLHAAKTLGVAPEDSLMIGDSQSDVKAARAAGFQIVCMSYGYNHGEDIRNYDPDAVVDSMAELPSLFGSSSLVREQDPSGHV
jgi:phosphoglycolate phosphatase